MSRQPLLQRYSTQDATAAGRYLSPLRYPGGKATIAQHLGDVYLAQDGHMPIEIWIEPFAGGAGAALDLLTRDVVDEAWLIDAHPALAAFWGTVIDDGERLAAVVAATVPTMQLWEQSREVLEAGDVGTFELAYAAFVINRCSRSGIVAPRSGPMEGATRRVGTRSPPDSMAQPLQTASFTSTASAPACASTTATASVTSSSSTTRASSTRSCCSSTRRTSVKATGSTPTARTLQLISVSPPPCMPRRRAGCSPTTTTVTSRTCCTPTTVWCRSTSGIRRTVLASPPSSQYSATICRWTNPYSVCPPP